MTETDRDLQNLRRRLMDLEGSHRRLRIAALAGPVLFGAVLLLGTTSDRAVRATSLQIVDGRGRPRILLSLKTGLGLFDAQGRPRAILSVDSDGPTLALYGETSRNGVILDVRGDGPALTLRDPQGRNRAVLTVLGEGPGLILADDKGATRAAVVQRNDTAEIALMNADGRPVWHAP
jgi:hypothetical protein